jgi:hypothetical protein
VGVWTLFHRADGRTVAVGCRAVMLPHHLGVLFGRDTDPGVTAMLLDRYHRATGMSWRGTCATTALAAIRLTWEDAPRQPRWTHPGNVGHAAGPLVWSRELNPDEATWGHAHTFDANAAYLGSAGGAVLAWSTLDHTGPRTFDRRVAGYWRVALGDSTRAWMRDPARPPLIPPGRIVDGHAWLTTPLADLLGQLGDPLRVVETWTASDAHGQPGARVLRQWAESVRDARAAVATMPAGPVRTHLEIAVKHTYKDAVGGMQRPGMRIVRADWAHIVIDLWRATLLRRLIQVRETQGVWPYEVKTDAVTFADCLPAPRRRGATGDIPTLTESMSVTTCAAGCGCAPPGLGQLGTFKHQSSEEARRGGR